MLISERMPVSEPVRRVELFTGEGRGRAWSAEEKAAILAEIYNEGETVCGVARRHWPKVEDGVVRLTAAQLQALLQGLD